MSFRCSPWLQWLTSWDWTQFVPDAIVALLTGVLVGVALLIAQWQREKRATTGEARDGAARLVHPLLLELQRAGDDPRYERLDKLSRRRETALRLIERSEAEIWHERRPTKITAAMLAYRNACWSQIAQGKELESGISRWCRDHAASPHTREFATAKQKGANHRDLSGRYTRADWKKMTADYALLTTSRRVTKPASRYRAKSSRAEQREVELRDMLVDVMQRRRDNTSWQGTPKRLY
jgi:hypothetical protein